MVISKDGYLTNGNDPDATKWASHEDQVFYLNSLKDFKLQLMGSGTYEAVKNNIKLDKNRLRVVFTKDPGHYKNVPEKLIFTDQSPQQVIVDYEKLGFKKAALVGGSLLYSSFLELSLIHDIYLDIEPLIFGSGKPLFINASVKDLTTKYGYTLEYEKPLNDRGTLQRHYIK